MMTNHKTTLLLVGLAVLLYSAQSLTATDEKQQIAPKITFLIIYRPGPAWLPGKSVSEQPLKEHGRYMLGLYVKGSMKLAGPLTDNAVERLSWRLQANLRPKRLWRQTQQ